MSSAENITKCITCGAELHPERAKKYNYCMAPDCQAKNLKGLTMVAVGVNKSAEQYLLLDEDTRTELAEGKYHDQRRGSFGVPTSATAASPVTPGPPAQAAPAQAAATPTRPASARPARAIPAQGPASRRPPAPAAGSRLPATSQPRRPGTASQRRLAVLYNQQGLRPDEIARKLGLSRYEVTQIILAARK